VNLQGLMEVHQPRNKNVLFSQCGTAWQSISPEVTVKGFKMCCLNNTVDEIDDDMLWNGSEEDGNVRSMRKIKALPVKMERVTLIDRVTQNLTSFVY